MTKMQDSPAELSYHDYEARQRHELTEAGLRERLPKLGVGGRARWTGDAWEPQAYPGYAFQAMVAPYPENSSAIPRMEAIRDALCAAFASEGEPALFPLPTASFHQTVVNTFSADRLEKYLRAPGIEADFPAYLQERLDVMPRPGIAEPVRMDLIGVSLFRTALGLLGVFPKEEDFDRVLTFRDAVYGDPELQELGLSRTRPFIGHITLAYIERPLSSTEGEELVQRIIQVNDGLAAEPIAFYMPEAKLHRYQHLAEFIPGADYPRFPL